MSLERNEIKSLRLHHQRMLPQATQRNEEVDNTLTRLLEETNRLVKMRAWFMSWNRNDIESLRFQNTELCACAKAAMRFWTDTRIALFDFKNDQYDGWWVDMEICDEALEVIWHHWSELEDPDCETSL